MSEQKVYQEAIQGEFKQNEISLVASVLRSKCPRCRNGHLYVHRNPYRKKDGLKMLDDCTICEQDFKIEPGFYIGALWTSFPVVVLLMALMAGISIGIFGMDPERAIIMISIVLFALQPVIIRFGRSVWIHIFVQQQKIYKS